MPSPLKLRVKFTGLCLFVYDCKADRSKVTVLLPDARQTGGPPRIPDGTHPHPHVGYLQWDLGNDRCRPVDGSGHYFFDGTEVEFDQEGETVEALRVLDTVANFSRIVSGSRVPANFLDGGDALARGGPGNQNLPAPPSPVLARIRLTSGKFLHRPHFLSGPFAFSGQLWEEGDGLQQLWPELAHSVLWETELPGSDAVRIHLSGQDEPLVLVPEEGDTVQITVANLCRDTPVATSIRGDRSQDGGGQRDPHGWDYHLDGRPEAGPDQDFVWYYKLLYPDRDEEIRLQTALNGFRLPIPYPSLIPGGGVGASGSPGGAGARGLGLVRGHSRQCFCAGSCE